MFRVDPHLATQAAARLPMRFCRHDRAGRLTAFCTDPLEAAVLALTLPAGATIRVAGVEVWRCGESDAAWAGQSGQVLDAVANRLCARAAFIPRAGVGSGGVAAAFMAGAADAWRLRGALPSVADGDAPGARRRYAQGAALGRRLYRLTHLQAAQAA